MAERVTEMSSGHLVEALERVIRDFNSRLGEQFGENFRRLDDSVARLVEWQERYREQMDSLHRAFDQAREGVEQAEDSLERMTGQALQITRHVEDQDATLSSLRRETVELEALLGSIAALRDRATEAFPAMDARLEAMLENIESAVQASDAARARYAAPVASAATAGAHG
jgi:chromosome segregation ATPase